MKVPGTTKHLKTGPRDTGIDGFHEPRRTATLPAWSLVLGVAGFLLFGVALASARSVPTSSWSISQQTATADHRGACTATAGYASFPSDFVETLAELRTGTDGKAALRFSTVPGIVPPDFALRQIGGARIETSLRRAWFDRGAAFPVTYVTKGLAYFEVDFGSVDRLLAGLDGSRTLTLEMEPARKGIDEYGQPAVAPNETIAYLLAGTSDLVAQLRACMQSLRAGQAFVPATMAPAPSAGVGPQTSPAQRVANRGAEVRVASREHPGSAALAAALLSFGDVQANAFLLSDAKASYREGLALAGQFPNDVPGQPQARSRLVEVELGLEQLDEAEADARATSDPRSWLAAIAVMRGDHQNGGQQFLTLLGELAGRRVTDLASFGLWLESDTAHPPEALRAARTLLTLWANAALGQEAWMSFNVFHPFFGFRDPSGSGNAVPAAQVAAFAFRSMDPTMFRDDLAVGAADRISLGQAALLRGEGLRSAGNLASVSSDLAFATAELSGLSEARGLTERVRIASVRLEANLGADDSETLADAQEVLTEIEAFLGPRSEVRLEAIALLAELQLRHGEPDVAEHAALEAAEISSATLGDAHSVTMRLRLLAAEARYARQDFVGAGRLAARALGFAALPAVSASDLRAVHTDPAGTSDAATRLRALARLVSATVPTRLDRVAVERIAAHRAQLMLDQVVRSLPTDSAEQVELLAVQEFAHAEEAALRQADVHRSLINQPPAEKLASVLQNFEYRRPTDRLDLSMLDVLTIGRLAAEYLRPDIIVPADNRPTIRYGQETTALEYLLQGLHRRFDAPGMSPHDQEVIMDVAICLAAAASRGDASGTISAKLFPNVRGIWGVPIGNPDQARQAVSSALYSQRSRSILLAQIHNAAHRGSGAVQQRLYIRALAFADHASALLAEAFSGDHAFQYIAGSATGTMTAQVQDYRQNLAPHEAVVIWLPLETSTEAFVISSNGIAWHRLPAGRRLLGRWASAIGSVIHDADAALRGGQPTLASFPVAEARDLYHALFEPLQADLRDVTHLFTGQLGITGSLPLHLLRVDEPGNDALPVWLGDRFAITRMPGLINPIMLYGDAPVRPMSRRLLAVGAPAGVAGPGDAGPISSTVPHLAALVHAAPEMRQVAQELGATGSQAVILQGRDATWSNVVQQLGASDHGVVMFATHGLTARDVGEPALLLAQPARISWSDDGLLHASDIAALHAAADLVILSACSTASLGEDGSEPLAGLATAFLMAGGRNVIASYWVLDDAAAPVLTGALVRARYVDGLDVAEALQQAMARLRGSSGSDHAYTHPFYWAAFEAIGLPWRPSAHTAAPTAPKARPAAAAVPSSPKATARGAGPVPVPLDPEASRVVAEAFNAENQHNCTLGQQKIRELGSLLRQGRRSPQQQGQLQNAAMALVLADRRCEMLHNLAPNR